MRLFRPRNMSSILVPERYQNKRSEVTPGHGDPQNTTSPQDSASLHVALAFPSYIFHRSRFRDRPLAATKFRFSSTLSLSSTTRVHNLKRKPRETDERRRKVSTVHFISLFSLYLLSPYFPIVSLYFPTSVVSRREIYFTLSLTSFSLIIVLLRSLSGLQENIFL